MIDQGLATQSPDNLAKAIGLFFILVLGLAFGSFARFYLVSWIGERVRALSRLSQDRVADVGSYVGENLSQIKTVQAFNHQPHDRRYFAEVSEKAFDIAWQR